MTEDLTELYESIRPRAVLMIETENRRFYASFKGNTGAEEFRSRLKKNELDVLMKDDDGKQKTYMLPWKISGEDKHIETAPGDLIVSGGDMLGIILEKKKTFATVIASIGNVTCEEMKDAFSEGDMTVRFSLEWSE